MKRWSSWLVAAGFVSFCMASLSVQHVFADYAGLYEGANFGPDHNFISNNVAMEYVVSRDGFTDVTSSHFKLYSPDAAISLSIYGADLCENIVDNTSDDIFNYPADGLTATTYTLYNNNGGSISSVGTHACVGTTNIMALNNGKYDPSLRMYVFDLDVTINTPDARDAYVNGFRLQETTSTSTVISQEPGALASAFGIQVGAPRGTNIYADMTIPFGPDCTVSPSGLLSKLTLYDDDNGAAGIQPIKFELRVYAINKITGVGTSVPLAITSGYAGMTSSYNAGSGYYTISSGDQHTVDIKFTAYQQYRYQLNIHQLYDNNTLQFSIPYSTVWYRKSCPAGVTRSLDVTPVSLLADDGDTVTGDFKITNPGNATGLIDAQAWVWREKAGSDTSFDPGDDKIYSYDTTGFGGASPPVIANPLTSGQLITTFSKVADVAADNGRICFAWRISPAHVDTVVVDLTFQTKCVNIAKKPKIRVGNGDVMAGGTLASVDPLCRLVGTPQVVGTISKNLYSSYADYGVTSLGSLSSFGSNGLSATAAVPVGFAATSLYGNTIPLGYFHTSPSGSTSTAGVTRCLNDPIARFSPQAAATSASTSVDLSTLGASTTYMTASNLNVVATSSLPANYNRVIYAPNATVTIQKSASSNGIEYANGPYANPSQIPRVIILSGKSIIVDRDVTRLDGLYGAKEDFVTCNLAAGAKPTLSICEKQLIINGIVVAGRNVLPYRSYGSDLATGMTTKAEIINLHPSALLNQLPADDGSDPDVVIKTVQEIEIPPRF